MTKKAGPFHLFAHTITQNLDVKAIGTLLVVAVLLLYGIVRWSGAFEPRSPLPPEALDQLRAFVENEGRPVSSADVFSMPGNAASPPAAEVVRVKQIRYLYPVPTHEAHGTTPAGSVMQFYRVEDTRQRADGAPQTENRLFYVYRDTGGAWRFLENKPLYGTPR